MKQQWEKLAGKIDGLALRERMLIFAAIAFVLVASVKVLYLDALLVQQKKLSSKIVLQQNMMKGLQAQMDASLKAKKDMESSPEYRHREQLRQELDEGDAFLQSRRDRLVAPEEMAELLQQVLAQNGALELIHLRTMPVAPLAGGALPKPQTAADDADKEGAESGDQMFKHGVEITVRGSYMDLLRYLSDLENLPKQMFWGKVEMKVQRYPVVELSLTVYTLSLEKTWLQI